MTANYTLNLWNQLEPTSVPSQGWPGLGWDNFLTSNIAILYFVATISLN